MNKKILILIGGVLALAIGLFFVISPGGKKSSKTKTDKMSQTSDPTLGGKEEINDTNSSTETNPSENNYGVTGKFLLEQYQEWAQYPPNSRPISSANLDIVYPFKLDIDALTLVDSPTDKTGNGYKCLLQPKTWAVIGQNNDMLIKLECRDSSYSLTKVSVLNATVFKEFEDQKTPTHSPDFNDDGRDGDEVAKDGIITFRWRPLKNDWGQMSLETNITYGTNKKAKLTTSFFSSPNKPAEFSNSFRESINSNGSLVIYATINVYRAGNYHLEANLKEAKEGNYLAFATYDGQLKQGTNEVEFLFFGKILRDKGYDGPYILTNARGHRVNLPIDPAWYDQGEEGLKKIQAAKTTEPDKELVIPFTEEFKTKAYTASQFSKKPWESEDKTRRIKELEEFAQQK
jgi:hypothetical protein